jgi:protein-S-isoprenylcysteine O-methyltransferase Ste14
MIPFPSIWWLFPTAVILLILFSLYLTRSGKMELVSLRRVFTAAGVFIGFLALGLPFFEQPGFSNSTINNYIGIPLTLFGLFGRFYSLLYLNRQHTSTTLNPVDRLVTGGPYAIVRHPQYTAGFIMLWGWYLWWGALYALYLLPLVTLVIYIQCLVEERCLLARKFGSEYAQYSSRVGMLVPGFGKKQRSSSNIASSDIS